MTGPCVMQVWVKCDSVSKTILLVNAIQNAEFLKQGQVPVMVEALLKHQLE